EGGAMVALNASEDEVQPHLTDRVSIAAVNGPASVVVAGDEDAVTAVIERFPDRKSKRLKVSHAFHSPLMDPMLDDFRQVAESLTYNPPQIPIAFGSDADYWVAHVRQPVRFLDTMRTLEAEGVQVFLELGPDAVLTAMGQDCADGTFIPTLRNGRPETETITTALARLHVTGVTPDWRAVLHGGRRVDLPTYAFQRRRYWPQGEMRPPSPDVTEVESRFWEAVEREDLQALVSALDVSGDDPLTAVLPALSSWRRQRREQSTVDAWRYKITWKPVTETRATPGRGPWLVVVPAGLATDERVLRTMEALGGRVVELDADATRDAVAARLLDAQIAGAESGETPVGVFSLLALDESPHPVHPALNRGLAATLTLVQALGDAGIGAPLWIATTGAVSIGGSDRVTSPAQAQVWGLGRVAGLEHPERWGGLVDLPETLDERAATRMAEVLGGADEDQVAIRPSGVFARRLVRAPQATPLDRQDDAGEARPYGTVLITGGTGALAGHAARWLAANGAEHIVLTSRRGAGAPGAAELERELAGLGVRVTVAGCDVTDKDALAGLLTEHTVTSVVHAAGLGHSGALESTTLGEFAEVLAAKAAGAAHLDELLGDTPVEAFVMFSSIAGIWGSGGGAAYAAANAYLDALAESRRGRGLAATALAWGPWAGGGMAAGENEEQLRRRGLATMRPDLAIGALAQAMRDGETALTIADVDWERFAPAFAAARPRPLLNELPEVRAALEGAAESEEVSSELMRRLAAVPEAERHQVLLDVVRMEAATVLGHPGVDVIGAGRAFREVGFDSLTAVELRNRLNAMTGLRLPATLVFDYPTPAALAAHLAGEIFPGATDAEAVHALEELDRLEAALSAVGPDDHDVRSTITTRLKALMSQWNAAPAVDGGDVAERLQTANADELLHFIDQELGMS
ncbi:SDR family NAD(P)-dependent oxidoreductase, partial [Microbispora sp. NPDC049125]|uniref:SDR family NAD(P)-dependent oxidoreductase n=1 Tax=Microbispora sp. NPDC049125 TaxID=3154929 RepID=UPI0034675E43